jgi:hypothetical protein
MNATVRRTGGSVMRCARAPRASAGLCRRSSPSLCVANQAARRGALRLPWCVSALRAPGRPCPRPRPRPWSRGSVGRRCPTWRGRWIVAPGHSAALALSGMGGAQGTAALRRGGGTAPVRLCSLIRPGGRTHARGPPPTCSGPPPPRIVWRGSSRQARRGPTGRPVGARHPLAIMRKGRLHLQRREAWELPPQLQQLRQTMEGALPLVRLADLVRQGEHGCGCPQAWRRPGARRPRLPPLATPLLAPLLAHGPTLGLVALAHRVAEVTAERLQDRAPGGRREDTLTAAKALVGHCPHR